MPNTHTKSENAKTGMVFFVGAGPGDPELLTLKGRKAIEGAGWCSTPVPWCPRRWWPAPGRTRGWRIPRR